MEQSTELRGWLGFLEDQVKLAIMAFQQDDDATFMDAISCVVQENFSGQASGHLRGTSVSIFDANAGKWKQTWVDNEGGYLNFAGELKDGQMILQREATQKDGTKFLQRMVWKNITANELDWSWEASRDGGKTWQVQWPIHYKRRS